MVLSPCVWEGEGEADFDLFDDSSTHFGLNHSPKDSWTESRRRRWEVGRIEFKHDLIFLIGVKMTFQQLKFFDLLFNQSFIEAELTDS